MSPSELTPEQAAAYVIGTAVGVASELLAKHWENEVALAKACGYDLRLPHDANSILHSANRHCINHGDMMSLFDRARGK